MSTRWVKRQYKKSIKSSDIGAPINPFAAELDARDAEYEARARAAKARSVRSKSLDL